MNPVRNYCRTTILFLMLSVSSVYLTGNSFSGGAEDLSWPEKRRKIVQNRVLREGIYGREDPFAPLGTEAAPTEKAISLNGIMWSEENPLAIINNIIVKVGDKIDNNEVIEIKKEEVILEKDGQRYILRIILE